MVTECIGSRWGEGIIAIFLFYFMQHGQAKAAPSLMKATGVIPSYLIHYWCCGSVSGHFIWSLTVVPSSPFVLQLVYVDPTHWYSNTSEDLLELCIFLSSYVATVFYVVFHEAQHLVCLAC